MKRATFYTKATGSHTDLSFYIHKGINWRLCVYFNECASNFHTYPKPGFWKIHDPRTPQFHREVAIHGVICLGKLRRIRLEPTRSPDTMPASGLSGHGLTWNINQSFVDIQEGCLSLFASFTQCINLKGNGRKKRKTKSSEFVKRSFKNHYASSDFPRQMEV